MCGIFGAIGEKFPSRDVLKALKRLDYRGYDSYGIATDSGLFEKHVGEIKLEASDNQCSIAISQTRWATHGRVTETNAHPHHDCKRSIFIVHNGIIENYQEIKENLKILGHEFYSETDSEIIAHYFEEGLKLQSVEETIRNFFSEAKGTFAVLLFRKGDEKLYAFKRDSPLVIGIGEGFFAASDLYAFSDKTDEAVFLEDDEYAVLTKQKFSLFDRLGKEIIRATKKFEWQDEAARGKYEHFMLKEIKEQPEAAERLLLSLDTHQKEKLAALAELIKSSRKTIFTACGSSYFTSLLGVYFLKKAGIETQTIIASEFKEYANVNENTLVIAISQSGETMDVIDSLKDAKQKNAKMASIVNVPYSTVQRMSDLSLQTEAGQEICVACTKTFTNQVILLLALAKHFGFSVELTKIKEEIKGVFSLENEIKELAHSLANKNDIYIIGRGLSYPVSREIALKLKEISYVHAEGMMGGELKHGTLALIEDGTPVIALVDSNEAIVSNVKEAEARGARIIAITNRKEKLFSEELKINAESDASFAIQATIVGQLLTYYIAKEKELPIDKPRSLAKSVTTL